MHLGITQQNRVARNIKNILFTANIVGPIQRKKKQKTKYVLMDKIIFVRKHFMKIIILLL